MIKNIWIILSIIFSVGIRPALAQPSPLDLTDSVDLSPLSLEEIMDSLIVAPDDADQTLEGPNDDAWQIRYRYARAAYEGYLDGSDSLTFTEVLEQFPVVPTEITQQAHLLEARRELANGWQVGILATYIRQATDHIRREGDPFKIESDGIGDTEVSIGKHGRQGDHYFRGNLNVSLPTGSIDEKGTTPRGSGTQLPYTMQIGSGTVDFKPSLTYLTRVDPFRVGLQGLGTLRSGRNDRDYRLGHRFQFTGFASLPANRWIEPSAKIRYITWDAIEGADEALNPSLAPVADPRRYGGERIEGVVGASVAPTGHLFDSTSFDFQFSFPLYESLTGPQPGLDYQISLSAQFQF